MSGHQSGHEGVVSQRGQEGEIALVENEPGLVPDPDHHGRTVITTTTSGRNNCAVHASR